MFKLDENYYLRKCFFEREPQVPTQTVMKNKMTPPLAQVYFKSMSYKLKVLAGLEPPMKGGGSDWYMPPNDLLAGRAVLKPVKKKHLSQLSYLGIDALSLKLVEDHHKNMELEKARTLLENDEKWKRDIIIACAHQWDDRSRQFARENTEKIQQAFREFTSLYSTSITKIETVLFEAAVKKIEQIREDAFQKMQERYQRLLKQQATALYDEYTERLMKKKAELKAKFIQDVEESNEAMSQKVHEINFEKHSAIEKLRHLLECQTLACQVYVALKEREECKKEIELSKHEHKKKFKLLKEQLAMKDFEIRLAIEKEKKRREFNKIWQEKVCHIVKKFQIFVAYCLNMLPEYADFFLNMEKLMMLQLKESMENPSVESLFKPDPDVFHTPVPRPHPLFLVCDKGFKPHIDQKLCPKHCTSSATQFPVIVINKRCIYAACDNYELFTDKLKGFINGQRGDETDFDDDHVYTYDVPIKYTSSTQLQELKLESSLMQVLQKERPNLKGVPTKCCVYPHCFCSPFGTPKMPLKEEKVEVMKQPSLASIYSGNKIETRSVELEHEREPKWESFMNYVKPKKCSCAKTAKKHLEEHLPAYMRKMSTYDAPDLPNYERCSLTVLKNLVKKAQGKRPPTPPPPKVPSKTKEVGTQYSDQEFDLLCTCFSDDEIKKLLKDLFQNQVLENRTNQFKFVDGSVSDVKLTQRSASFATDRAYSLRNLLNQSPQLEEIFKKDKCSFD